VNPPPQKTGQKLPFIFLNMAMTADGKIATANRAVASFGSARDLEHLYELRATADAVMCGARTVEASGTILGNGGNNFRRQRTQRGLADHPLRIIVSGSGSMDINAKIFKEGTAPIVILTSRRTSAKRLAELRAVASEVKICGAKAVDLRAAVRWLREKWRVKRLLCEGGAELNDALFRAGLVDEINLTICPKIFGGRQAPTVSDGIGFASLALTREYRIHSIRAQKGELFTVYRRAGKAVFVSNP
jgi:2,5-diamino-6-(ribosylamino)-4(3H)-pyrimidinone 5'-phosphate reductase